MNSEKRPRRVLVAHVDGYVDGYAVLLVYINIKLPIKIDRTYHRRW